MDSNLPIENSIEEIIFSARPNYIPTLLSYKTKVEKEADIDPDLREKLLQKINFAILRVKAPLEAESSLRYLFIPFGIVTLYWDPRKGDIDHYKELGFITKTKQLVIPVRFVPPISV